MYPCDLGLVRGRAAGNEPPRRREVGNDPSRRGGVRRDYREVVLVLGVPRYVFVTSLRDLQEGSRTILVQSISMSPADHWQLVTRLPEVFAGFTETVFGDFRGWSETIAATVSDVIDPLRSLNSPWGVIDYRTFWPRNFTFTYRRMADGTSWVTMNHC